MTPDLIDRVIKALTDEMTRQRHEGIGGPWVGDVCPGPDATIVVDGCLELRPLAIAVIEAFAGIDAPSDGLGR